MCIAGLANALNQEYREETFEKLELESLGRTAFDTISLFFQTGSLTIKGEKKDTKGRRLLRLDYPNDEVREYLSSEAFKEILQVKFEYSHLETLRKALDNNDPNAFYGLLDSYFRSVPFTIFKAQSAITNVECFYSAVLAFALQFLPKVYRVQAEDPTSDGSVDLVIETPTRLFLIEHKVLARGLAAGPDRQRQLQENAKQALQQIDKMKYAAKFSIQTEKLITKVGVCFDAEHRSVGYVEVVKESL